MPRDPLKSLLRLRRMAVDQARRSLADSLQAETGAADAVASLTLQIERETEAACSLGSDDADVETFAAWLHRIRPIQAAAQEVLERAEQATNCARGILAAARAAEEAVEAMLAEHERQKQQAEAKSEQRLLDEAGGRSKV